MQHNQEKALADRVNQCFLGSISRPSHTAGDRIIMTTSHLENLPLPDHNLLDLQYHLRRPSSVAAAVEVDDSYNKDWHQPTSTCSPAVRIFV